MDHVWNLIVWLVVVVVVVVCLHHRHNRNNRRDVPGNYHRYVACRESWRLISHLETMALVQQQYGEVNIKHFTVTEPNDTMNLVPSAHLPYWHWSSLVDCRIGIFYFCQRMELVLRECGATNKEMLLLVSRWDADITKYMRNPNVKTNRLVHKPYLSATLRHSLLRILWHQLIQPLINQLSPYSLQS